YTFVISGSGIKQKTVSIPVNQENKTISIVVESISIDSAEGWATARNNYSRNAVSNAEIDAESLTASWSYASPGAMVFSSPVVSDGKVVFTTDRGYIVAI
ncbi:hypothetical protein J4G37_60500, partial [Microvirga sp. 3-52]|nr:hypothetical protein [Microvirga sp. 3-52]